VRCICICSLLRLVQRAPSPACLHGLGGMAARSMCAEDGEVRAVEKQGTCILSVAGRPVGGPALAVTRRLCGARARERERRQVVAGAANWPASRPAGRSMRACALLFHRARLACAAHPLM
jgi:hypothetical protein